MLSLPICLLQQLLAMVPQPVVAVMLLYPITKESEEANKKGASHWSSKGQRGTRWGPVQC